MGRVLTSVTDSLDTCDTRHLAVVFPRTWFPEGSNLRYLLYLVEGPVDLSEPYYYLEYMTCLVHSAFGTISILGYLKATARFMDGVLFHVAGSHLASVIQAALLEMHSPSGARG